MVLPFPIRPMSGPASGRKPGLSTALRPLLAALVGLALWSAAATAQDAYRIRAGDVLRIEVIEDEALGRSVLVSPDGRISVPLAGPIRASGLTLEEVQAALVAQLAPNFASGPTAFVSIERLAERPAPVPQRPVAPATDAIYVMGEVGRPGLIEVAPGTTVLQLFAQAGGFTRFAATRRIQLRRRDAAGAEQVYPLDYDAILDGRSPNGSAVLVEGDVIVVPERHLFE
ncbi:polysaccharide biosynthesis/export family protein [Limimaricola pyoseonensis]|uniref:Polysaccharide export outer membrane protein n=1 Tax=Limimaricola pyoseonensis TaxID=521013 RepID=A0A1G7IX04_9RHOB|nr:polysaccharide biosynthesis/export family protein [Limimaricola pyoseonensis]SDF17211.1 polysaccharide export outer membrane protein [Limimaricola pyoseonensis]